MLYIVDLQEDVFEDKKNLIEAFVVVKKVYVDVKEGPEIGSGRIVYIAISSSEVHNIDLSIICMVKLAVVVLKIEQEVY